MSFFTFKITSLYQSREWSGRIMHLSLLATLVVFFLLSWSGTTDTMTLPRLIVATMLVAIGFGAWAYQSFIKKEIKIYRTMVEAPTLLLVAVVFLSTILSISPWHSLFGQLHTFSFSALLCVVLALWSWLAMQDILSRGNMDSYVITLLSAALLGLLTSFVQSFPLLHSALPLWLVLSGTPSTVTIMAGLTAVLSAAYLLEKKHNQIINGLSTASLIVSFLVLVRFDFTIGFAVWSCGLLMLFLASLIRVSAVRPGWLVLISAGIIIGITELFVTNPAPIRASLPTEVALGFIPSYQIARDTVTYNATRLLVGSGPSTFALDARAYRSEAFNLDERIWQTRFDNAMNTVFTLTAEIGVAGLFAFILLCAAAIRLWLVYLQNQSTGLLDALIRKIKTLPGQQTWLVGAVERSRLYAIVFLITTIFTAVTVFDTAVWIFWWFVLVQLIIACLLPDKDKSLRVLHLPLPPKPLVMFGVGSTMIVLLMLAASITAVNVFRASRLYTRYVAAMAAKSDTGNFDVAKQLLGQAINAWPREAMLWQKKAELQLIEAKQLAINGDGGEKSVSLLTSAVQDALRATALSPRSADAWNTLATLYAYSRSLTPTALEESYKAMEKALQLEPTNALLAWRLATLYQSSAEWQKAEQYAIQAIMLKPNYVDAYVTLAQIYEGAGERNKAFQVFAAGEQYLNQSPIAMFEYGRLLYNEGSDAATAQAKLVWEKALELQPNYADALYGLRRLAERTGDKDSEQIYKDKLRSLGVQVE